MLQAYTNLDCDNVIKLSGGDRVVFNTKKIQTGTTATICSKGEEVYLNKPGFYEVNLEVTVLGGGATPMVTMHVDGEKDESSLGYGCTGSDSVYSVITFTTIVQVCPTCCKCKQRKELTFIYKGDVATLQQANIVVTKLC